MRPIRRSVLALVLAVVLLCSVSPASLAADGAVRVGAARADITGPITEISTGYNSLGDMMEGLLTRLYARAFVVDDGKTPMALVSAELVHMTESIKPGVLAKLRADGYDMFAEENLMLLATHCHSSTSNTSWYALYDLVNGVPGYDDESWRVIVRGVARAIEQAWDARVAGSVSLVYGDKDIDTCNRSADAFLQNHNAADYGYAVGADGSYSYQTGLAAARSAYNHEMAGIVLTDSRGRDLGFLNFYGSHGTSNPIENRFVASDHKGYAALRVEQEMGDGFVAAFAQADSGDASPNAVVPEDYHLAFRRPTDLDLSLDAIENQIVSGRQEADAALQLLRSARRTPLQGVFDENYTAVDFSDVTVDLSYVGGDAMPYDDLSAGTVRTCEPCIGAGIIAGDEEGAPVDNAEEGAVRHQFVYNARTGRYDRIACDFTMIDLGGLERLFEPLWPTAMWILNSDHYDDAQMEKVVCLAVGELMQKAQPLQLMRFGSLVIAGVPFELTFEQANRTRAVLERTLAPAGVAKVVLATHANSYSQYVTTREEFAAQHYEGATCLFGPWSGAALTQELDRLAQGIVSGRHADPGVPLRETEPDSILITPAANNEPAADSIPYGTLLTDVSKREYIPGEWVTATFSAVNPRHVTALTLADDPRAEDYSYLLVEKQVGRDWVTVKTDTDPYTTIRCVRNGGLATGWQATVGWLLKGEDLSSGVYRLVYQGFVKNAVPVGSYRLFRCASSAFTVNAEKHGNSFRDVSSSAYYYDAVLWALNHTPPVAAGTSADRFSPDEACTRAQAVTFLWRAFGCPAPKSTSSRFADVRPGDYYHDAVLWATERGITNGTGDTTFSPDAPCTRAQIVTFLWRAEGSPAARGAVRFADVPADAWYFSAVRWAVSRGVTNGTGTNAFSPDAPCTRAQIVTFLYRDLQNA